jgi:poly-gamma-glutamate capsule biosynthesis protein CapA/YwtB (metallophosphatase superfamily)
MSRRAGKIETERRDREKRRCGAALYLPSLSLLFAFLVAAAWTSPASAPGPEVPDLPAQPPAAWLYLRDGKPLPVLAGRPGAAAEPVVELIAVGDVMLGRGVAEAGPCSRQPLAAVAPWLRTADLTLGNLECVVAQGGAPRPGPYRLRAPLSAVASLRDAGFDLLGLANNHALDYGPEGLAETVSRLQEAGIAAVGAGPDAGAAFRPLIREIDGVRLAFLAFNSVPDPEDKAQEDGWSRAGWDRAQATAAIAAARAQADAVIVSIHWGYEYELRADPAQRDMAQAMLDAGADLVIGHHPHVVQGTEAREGGFVAYSLGNLVFDQQQGETRQGLALRAFFDEQGLRAVQALPVRAGPCPRLMSADEAASLLARLQPSRGERDEPLPRRIGFACQGPSPAPGPVEACRPVEVPQSPRQGPFGSGEIDLTGDGVPEQVQRVGEQVTVYRDGVEVWRGLAEWRVADLALGDPNDDGRGEMLLAVWKPDAAGNLRSQPFIVGYREGAYRVVWGGSAVADPIQEVELGDVDGDGVQELVVLEEREAGQAVAVWRWHGWGFSLEWRSPPGRYRDLALIPGQAGSPLVITVASEP